VLEHVRGAPRIGRGTALQVIGGDARHRGEHAGALALEHVDQFGESRVHGLGGRVECGVEAA
jgi:hypothetical protein